MKLKQQEWRFFLNIECCLFCLFILSACGEAKEEQSSPQEDSVVEEKNKPEQREAEKSILDSGIDYVKMAIRKTFFEDQDSGSTKSDSTSETPSVVLGKAIVGQSLKRPQSPVPEESRQRKSYRPAGEVKEVPANENVSGEKKFTTSFQPQSEPNQSTEFLLKTQDLASALFRRLGFFSDGRLLPMLQKYQPLTRAVICELILRDTATPRLRPVGGALPRRAKTPSPLEMDLAKMFQTIYPDFDPVVVRQRQQYWQQASGADAEKQKAMLTKDPIMQAIALDMVICSGVNEILKQRNLAERDRTELQELLLLRYCLLDPVAGERILRKDQ